MPVQSTKRRYLLVHIETEVGIDSDYINQVIETKINFLYGVTGAVKMNYQLIEYYPEEKNAIVRCNHIMLNELRTTLAHISEMREKPVRIDVKLVSGTIKSLKKHLQKV
jgi:RNase P/RNase MRP subunit POP5